MACFYMPLPEAAKGFLPPLEKCIKLCGALQLDQHYLMTNGTGTPAAVVCIFIGVNYYFRSVFFGIIRASKLAEPLHPANSAS